MITMTQKQEVILRFFRDSDSKSKISRDLKIHRQTVRDYINEYLAVLEKEKRAGTHVEGCLSTYVSEPPKYHRPTTPKPALTEEVCKQIDLYLTENKRKRREGMRKQIMLKKDIHEALVEQGFSIGYTTVCNYISKKKHQEMEAFIRQDYMPGESCEFDWGEATLIIGGEKRKLYMSAFTGAYSNYRYGMLYEKQDTLAFMESHIEFIAATGGVYQEYVYDNMRVAVKKFVGRSQREPTRALLQLSGYYKFRFRFCNVGKGNEKGHVERSIEFIRRKAFSRRYAFASLAEANKHLVETCNRLNNNKLSSIDKIPRELFADEKKVLWQPEGRMACFMIEYLKVDKYSTITYENNHYSVPDHLVGKGVDIKVFSSRLECYVLNKRICTHERSYGRKQWILDLSHYYRTLLVKPRALHNSMALKQSSELIRELYHLYFSSTPQEFIKLLLFCDKHEYSTEQLKGVIEVLRKLCPNDVSVDKIKALLGNTGILAGQIDESHQTVQFSKEQLLEYTRMTGQN
jgi:transposase